jgi:hypothetical protein
MKRVDGSLVIKYCLCGRRAKNQILGSRLVNCRKHYTASIRVFARVQHHYAEHM